MAPLQRRKKPLNKIKLFWNKLDKFKIFIGSLITIILLVLVVDKCTREESKKDIKIMFNELKEKGGMLNAEEREIKDVWESWNSYVNIDGKGLTKLWLEAFYDVRYKMAGVTEKFKTADCGDAFYHIWRRFGYKGKTRNVAGTKFMIKKLNKLGMCKIRNKRTGYRDVKTTDIIIFKPNRNGIPHIGTVIRRVNGWIIYVDMNASGWVGLAERIRPYNKRVDLIAETSFWLFAVDYLEDLERKK